MRIFTLGIAVLVTSCSDVIRDDHSKQISIRFLGDTSFGESYANIEEDILQTKGYAFPLENYRTLLLSADFVIANLETPITDRANSPFTGKKDYIHRNKSGRAPQVLADHNITAVSLANNHSMDFGAEGLTDTKSHLETHDIRNFGAGNNSREAVLPLEIPLSSKRTLYVFSGFEHDEWYNNNLHFYADDEKAGVLNLSDTALIKSIRSTQAQSPNALIVVFPHWGENYQWESDEQRASAKDLIAAGADLIIGHGAHQLQGIERIDGKWVIYGLGNFMFNSPGRYIKIGAPPYSLISSLIIEDDERPMVLRLYPIHTDNLVNGYQGDFVTQGQFSTVHKLLAKYAPEFMDEASISTDQFGWHLEILL